jgi:hypothetical protein
VKTRNVRRKQWIKYTERIWHLNINAPRPPRQGRKQVVYRQVYKFSPGHVRFFLREKLRWEAHRRNEEKHKRRRDRANLRWLDDYRTKQLAEWRADREAHYWDPDVVLDRVRSNEAVNIVNQQDKDAYWAKIRRDRSTE